MSLVSSTYFTVIFVHAMLIFRCTRTQQRLVLVAASARPIWPASSLPSKMRKSVKSSSSLDLKQTSQETLSRKPEWFPVISLPESSQREWEWISESISMFFYSIIVMIHCWMGFTYLSGRTWTLSQMLGISLFLYVLCLLAPISYFVRLRIHKKRGWPSIASGHCIFKVKFRS